MTARPYSIEDKLAGRDLHGLSSRVPTPTDAQSRCSHTRDDWVDNGYEDWEGVWRPEVRYVKVSTCVDIPGTNNFRCTQCGYTRRY